MSYKVSLVVGLQGTTAGVAQRRMQTALQRGRDCDRWESVKSRPATQIRAKSVGALIGCWFTLLCARLVTIRPAIVRPLNRVARWTEHCLHLMDLQTERYGCLLKKTSPFKPRTAGSTMQHWACACHQSFVKCTRHRAVATLGSLLASVHLPTAVYHRISWLRPKRSGRTSAAATIARGTQWHLVHLSLYRTRRFRLYQRCRQQLIGYRFGRTSVKDSLSASSI